MCVGRCLKKKKEACDGSPFVSSSPYIPLYPSLFTLASSTLDFPSCSCLEVWKSKRSLKVFMIRICMSVC